LLLKQARGTGPPLKNVNFYTGARIAFLMKWLAKKGGFASGKFIHSCKLISGSESLFLAITIILYFEV
jgi:hypothetical protein